MQENIQILDSNTPVQAYNIYKEFSPFYSEI